MTPEPILPRWRQLLRQIQNTQAEELSCSECFEQISTYVDLEMAGEPAAERLPHFRQHLDQCGVCRAEYEVLGELARLEAQGGLPDALD